MAFTVSDHLWCGETGYPTLYIDDVSAIPFLVHIAGVEEYQHRARVRAEDGDLFGAVTPPAEGYEAYCRDVLGLGSVEPIIADPVGSPLEVAAACAEGQALRAIVRRARDGGGLSIHPYMSVEAVWELAARVAAEARVPVRVIGPPPKVTWIANDKKAFSELVEETLGAEWIVRTTTSNVPEEIARHLVDTAKGSRRVGLKRTRCASAMGNEVFDAAAVRPENALQLVRTFLNHTEWDGHEEVLVVAWEDADLSPSTQTWIPPASDGEPVVEGIYEQILEGPEQVFLGSRPAALSPEVLDTLASASVRVATELQRLGYVGRCSFDFLLRGERARFVECNGRWGGTSIPMSLVDRFFPEGRPPYRAQDFVRSSIRGMPFTEVLSRVGDDLFRPATGTGRYVFYNVGPLELSGKLDVIALGETQEDAERALEEELDDVLAP